MARWTNMPERYLLAGIEDKMETALARMDEPVPPAASPDVNIEFNPDINVDVDFDTSGIESELFEMRLTQEGIGRTLEAGFRDAGGGLRELAGEIRGIKKLGAIYYLEKSLGRPEVFRAVYKEVVLEGQTLDQDTLIALLRGTDFFPRMYAIFELAARKTGAVELISQLNDENKVVATWAYAALLRIKPAFLPRGSRIPVDSNIPHRCWICLPNDTPEFSAVLNLLQNGSPLAKRRALRLLSKLETGENFWHQLTMMTVDADPFVQADAFNTLLKIGYKRVESLDRLLEGMPSIAVSMVNAAIVVAWVAKQQREAFYAISYLGAAVQYYSDCREGAIVALSEAVRKGFDTSAAVYALTTALEDPDKKIRKLANRVLVQINPPLARRGMSNCVAGRGGRTDWAQDSPALAGLVRLLQNSNVVARQRAILVIRELQDGYVLTPELLERTGDPDEKVRNLAVAALVRFRDKIVPTLEHVLRDPTHTPNRSNRWRKDNARFVLEEIRKANERDVLLADRTIKLPRSRASVNASYSTRGQPGRVPVPLGRQR